MTRCALPGRCGADREGREIARRIGPAEWDGAEMVDYLRARIGR